MRITNIESPTQTYLQELLTQFKNNTAGSVATYIPELAKANSEWFGIALVTVDGHVYQVGDSRQPFTIQSISKPFTYALTLDKYGIDHVLGKVGVEPSGEAFNEISLEGGTGRPFNPMINAGAIATAGLVPGDTLDMRFENILKAYEKFAAHKLIMDEAVYRSESDTGNRNRAIAYLLRNSNILEENTEETLELYFRQCSVLVTCRDLAVMGATLANNGVNPITNVVGLKSENVEKVLSIMSTCGMYDYAGGWIYDVGMPAKSGVSGGIMAVLPGQLGIGVFSPLLDMHGNSVRGIEVCRKISLDFGLHMFDSSKASNSIIRAKYDTATITSKKIRTGEEVKLLRAHGGQIKIYELAGDMIFSAIDFVLETVISEFEHTGFLIFDLKRVTAAKKSACYLMASLIKKVKQNGKHVFFTNAGYQFNKLLKLYIDRPVYEEVFMFADNNSALEWCENMLIRKYKTSLEESAKVPLAEQLLLEGFSGEELQFLKTMMKKRIYEKGDVIIKEGDPSNSLFFLTLGEVSVNIRGGRNNHQTRIATMSAGRSFGEMSLIDRRNRSASVLAESPVECYELLFTSYDDVIEVERPKIKEKLLTNIAVDLSNKLRKANQEIKVYQ
ncbi:MAG: glutaminase A [Gammaproteobacteria bacterium]